MRDLVPIFVVGIITLGIYRLFELYARRQERLEIIDKLSSNNEIKDIKLDLNMSFWGKTDLSWIWSLRAALLMMGVGLGLMVAFFIEMSFAYSSNIYSGDSRWYFESAISLIYFACISFFGGTGLLISYLIESRKNIKNENRY